jgi:voltage-gated potassium channel
MVKAPAGLRARLGNVLLGRPFLRRLSWHARRISSALDERLLIRVISCVLLITIALSMLVLVVEGRPITMESLAASFNWSVYALLGKGDATYLTTLAGFVISWVVVLIGAALVGTITAGMVAVIVDFLLKEGQGMGAAGFKDHVVVCGWNPTARDLVTELRGDAYGLRVVLISNSDRNPAGAGVYFVKGDATLATDLKRAGIDEAAAAIVFPADDSAESDMRSILTVMAIESVAPGVRTVAAVNDPALVEHFHRAGVDEVLVTSRLASRLLARAALYPGLTGLVTDIVSGGKGSELYRVTPPAEYDALPVDDVSRRLRAEHRATLVGVVRHGEMVVNPTAELRLGAEDEIVVIAEGLGRLTPSSGSDEGHDPVRLAPSLLGHPAPAPVRR